MILDVDKFKEVNDRYGHMAGDKVLSEFGRILKAHFREEDVVGRIGGDEFVVYIRRTEDREIADIRIRELISKVRQIHFPELKGGNVTISVGVCFAPEHGTCYMDLYQKQILLCMRRNRQEEMDTACIRKNNKNGILQAGFFFVFDRNEKR